MANTALQIANPARVKLNLINCEKFPKLVQDRSRRPDLLRNSFGAVQLQRRPRRGQSSSAEWITQPAKRISYDQTQRHWPSTTTKEKTREPVLVMYASVRSY